MANSLFGDRYRLVRPLGEGGMGLVYQVADQTTGRLVALKVIRADVLGEKSGLQFKQEFRLMIELRHPNCCEVYDYGQLSNGAPYITMELVSGACLDCDLALPTKEMRAALGQVLLALGYLHRQGFVHRDVKAENIRLRPDGVVKLMDYGLMERAGQAGLPIAGTLTAMAPEAFQRGALDPRTDLYAVGCLAYELLTGRPPFSGEDATALVKAHLMEAPVPPGIRVAGVPPDLERWVLRLLAKSPDDRFQTSDDAIIALGGRPSDALGDALLSPPLIGREGVLTILNSALEKLTNEQRGGVVTVIGEAGSGKSRVLEAFRAQAQLAEVPVAEGRDICQGLQAYGPFVSLLRALLALGRAPAVLASRAAVLARVLPELAPVPALPLENANSERQRLQQAFIEVFEAYAIERPFVAWLDAWQDADPLSLALWQALQRTRSNTPILWLLAVRSGKESVPSEGEITVARLEPLSLGEVQRMAQAMLGQLPVTEALAHWLLERAQGNPGQIVRLLDYLLKNDALSRRPGAWELARPGSVAGLSMGPGGSYAMLQRDLHVGAFALLRVAAVLGRAFTLDDLASVAALPEEQLFEALDALIRAGAIAKAADGSFAFVEEDLPSLVEADFSNSERERLHRACAAALGLSHDASASETMPLARLLQLASHALRAPAEPNTLHYALAAGRRSLSLVAMAEAERFLVAGQAMLRIVGGEVAAALAPDYLEALGDLERLKGALDKAIAYYQQALAIARVEDPGRASRLLTSLAKCQQIAGRGDEALDTLADAAVLAVAANDPVARSRALHSSANGLYHAGRFGEALLHAERGLVAADESGLAGHLARALSFLGFLCLAHAPERLAEGREYLLRAIAVIERPPGVDVNIHFISYNYIGNAQMHVGDYGGALDSFQKSCHSAREIGLGLEKEAWISIAMCTLALGNYLEAARTAELAFDCGERSGTAFFQGLSQAVVTVALVAAGRLAGAEERMASALEIAQKWPYEEEMVRGLQIELLLMLNKLASAAPLVTALEVLGLERRSAPLQATAARWRAELACREGSIDAVAAANRALSLAEGPVLAVCARRLLALALFQAGEKQDSMRQATQALADAKRYGFKPQAVEALQILGDLAIERGDDAIDYFTEMAALASQMGAPFALARAKYGQAALRPEAPGASELVKVARQSLSDVLRTLNEADRRDISSTPTLATVLTKDLPDPVAKPRPQAPAISNWLLKSSGQE